MAAVATWPAAILSCPPLTVIPAQAGIQNGTEKTRPLPPRRRRIPAYAGMTVERAGSGNPAHLLMARTSIYPPATAKRTFSLDKVATSSSESSLFSCCRSRDWRSSSRERSKSAMALSLVSP